MKSETTTICLIDGMHVDDCPHLPCKECKSTLSVCGGCFNCLNCHSGYADCADWLIGVEVVVRVEKEDLDHEHD